MQVITIICIGNSKTFTDKTLGKVKDFSIVAKSIAVINTKIKSRASNFTSLGLSFYQFISLSENWGHLTRFLLWSFLVLIHDEVSDSLPYLPWPIFQLKNLLWHLLSTTYYFTWQFWYTSCRHWVYNLVTTEILMIPNIFLAHQS